ncbi:hypothetical protein Sjap_003061 [Stephania japonica]|uniref:Uncharacterized protein n=1 Tax=Stephania japonica TaxID=461633 RepID=A0AAP0KN77_9MAGN
MRSGKRSFILPELLNNVNSNMARPTSAPGTEGATTNLASEGTTLAQDDEGWIEVGHHLEGVDGGSVGLRQTVHNDISSTLYELTIDQRELIWVQRVLTEALGTQQWVRRNYRGDTGMLIFQTMENHMGTVLRLWRTGPCGWDTILVPHTTGKGWGAFLNALYDEEDDDVLQVNPSLHEKLPVMAPNPSVATVCFAGPQPCQLIIQLCPTTTRHWTMIWRYAKGGADDEQRETFEWRMALCAQAVMDHWRGDGKNYIRTKVKIRTWSHLSLPETVPEATPPDVEDQEGMFFTIHAINLIDDIIVDTLLGQRSRHDDPTTLNTEEYEGQLEATGEATLTPVTLNEQGSQ